MDRRSFIAGGGAAMIPALCPAAPYVVPTTMIDVIKHLGLTSGLQLCLDAGDINSYDGTSQTWKDVSGNGNHFYRGSGSGSDSFDPTFNGTAGRQSSSEYFSSGGGNAFWQAGSHTFANNWHKDAATFTVAGWTWTPSGAALSTNLIATAFDPKDNGVVIGVSRLSGIGTAFFTLSNGNGVSGELLRPPTDDTMVEGQWMFVGISFAEGTGNSFARLNSTVELFSSDSYTSPSASNPSGGIAIWGNPDDAGTALTTLAFQMPSSGARINSLTAWNAALSQAQITALFDLTKGKFGL